ncbi:uncharacterized protein LOC119395000 [Rhipicephalus sanguineus]|uniref:uncharacterized protein LOC119395000 n=1 Tax=Rhipicephalus sanguineus TaxID=34632 RepID=UPI001892FDB6|nr:uncharacterized protein LOC119395000 [Rhipicephalus sanguineus]
MGAAHSEAIDQDLADHTRPRAPGLRVALPKLQVPVFSGENREWQGFWELYEATIHTHPDLTGIEKFKYLKTYLAGAAKRAIEGISLTEANYNIAVKFRTGCLESLGMLSSEYAVVLHRVLMRSLPEDLAIQCRKRTKTGADAADSAVQSRDEQVKAILKFLQVEVESREESRASREKATSGRPSTNRKAAETSSPPHLPSALALTARSSSPGATSRPAQTICPLCDISGHLTQDCRAALSAEEKHQRLSSNSCCFRCGKQGHIARSCRTAAWLKCDRCSGRHISALCDIWGRRGSESPQSAGAENRGGHTARKARNNGSC